MAPTAFAFEGRSALPCRPGRAPAAFPDHRRDLDRFAEAGVLDGKRPGLGADISGSLSGNHLPVGPAHRDARRCPVAQRMQHAVNPGPALRKAACAAFVDVATASSDSPAGFCRAGAPEAGRMMGEAQQIRGGLLL
jgi:hypothetical protein